MRRKIAGFVALVVLFALVGEGCASSASAGRTPHAPPVPTCAPGSSILPPTSVGLPAAGTVSATFSSICPANAYGGIWLAADDSAAWVYNASTGIVTRIDPATNTVAATITVHTPCDQCGGNIAIGDGAVWVDEGMDNTVTRIDPRTNKVVATINANGPSNNPTWLAVTPGAVWVGDYYGGEVSRIDPQTNKLAAAPALSNEPGALSMSYGAGSLWLCNYHRTPGLLRLDPASLQAQAQIDVSQSQGFGCVIATAGDNAIWVQAKGHEGYPVVLERIDPATNRVTCAATAPGSGDASLAANAQGVWYFETQLGLFRLDPQTCKAVSQFAMIDGAGGLGLGAGSIWVANQNGIVSRITPAS
jgi:streptogramin lyase